MCLFDGQVIPVTFGPYKAGNKTRAHRFLSSAVVEVTDFEGYKKSLETGHVLLDREDRKAKIKENAEALAAQENLIVKDDPALLDEVAGLVEWPVVLKVILTRNFWKSLLRSWLPPCGKIRNTSPCRPKTGFCQ